MLGSTPLTAILGAAPDPTDHLAVRQYIKAACEQGLAILLVMPGTKQPFDGRTARARNAADKIAQTEAQAAGRRDWTKAKSPSGLALATSDSKMLLKKNGYLDEWLRIYGTWENTGETDSKGVAVRELVAHPPINLAVEVGQSALIVVDCDTEAQKANFLEVSGAPEDMPPTVLSPGQIGPNGEWVHSNGGHFYFTVDDIDIPTLPRGNGSMTWGGEDGFAILWDRRYVLIPPSVRAEGAYELAGRDYPAPQWIIDAIKERAAAREARQGNQQPFGALNTEIEDWAEGISWDEILEPLGWTPTARPDSCGCDVYTAPGEHANPKSATAHDPGCSDGRYNGYALHIWTDNPGEPFASYIAEAKTNTLSKLQAVAWSEFEGDTGKTLEVLGLGGGGTELTRELGLTNDAADAVGATHSAAEDIKLPEPAVRDENPDVDTTSDYEPEDQDEDPADAESFPEPEDAPTPDIFECGVQGVPIIAPFSHWRDMPPPEFIVEGLIEHGGLSCVIGSPGIGKSSVVLDMALCIATGRPWQGRKTLKTRVLYLPGEGLSGAVQRIKAWSYVHDTPHEVIDDGIRLGNDIIRAKASTEAWGELAAYVIRQKIGLIIYDTFARMATGLEENSATDVGDAVVRFDQMRKLTGAGALIVHHNSKGDPTKGRGSSALQGALDSELLVSEASWSFEDEEMSGGRPPGGKPIELTTTKQKNAEQLEDPIPLLMKNCTAYDAPYITGRSGSIDPMMGEIVLARPRPEPIVETAIRIQEFLAQFTELGMTKAEIVAGVKADAYTRTRVDATKAWKQHVLLSIDAGIRYGSITNQLDSTTRFIAGPETPENARTAHTRYVMGEDD